LREFSTYLAATPLDAKPPKSVQFSLHFVPEWKRQTLPQITLITLIFTDKKFDGAILEIKNRHQPEDSCPSEKQRRWGPPAQGEPLPDFEGE
jgi:hypothetical protein